MGVDDGEELVPEPNGREEKNLVSVRLRPLNEKEKARNDVSDWECINDNTIIYRNPLQTPERSLYPTAYTFDRVFRCHCTTRQVYEEGAKEVALSVVSGINSSVFAYGQTSSGKTYTMCGVTEYTVADIYDYTEKHEEREFLLKFSAMEIYNESVRDLLSADSTPLRLLDDPERGTIVDKLTEETLRDWNHFKELLSICEAQRQIGDTSLNETSSRSHQILRLTVESSSREFLGNDNSSTLAATVNFVDLAGSERASQALSAGTRLKEGCHINRSLLTLGTVIRKLSKGRTGHIPFRDSKLTRILQSTLVGNARTAIICTMSPARSHVEQSRNTLLFASCAKEVTTNAKVNVLMSDKSLVKHLQRELARLEGELRNPGSTSVASDSAALLREKDTEIAELKKEMKELTMQREHLIMLQEELTLQRDLAQSQLKDLLQIVGSDRLSVVSADDDHQYPKLRVRKSVWEPENSITETPPANEFQSPFLSVRGFDASQYSDGHSRSNSDDNYPQFSDMDESYRHRDTSPSPSVCIPTYVGTRISVGATEEDTDENSDEDCKVVRCVETEEPSESGYTDSISSYPEKRIAISVVARIENDEELDKEELESPSLKDDEEIDKDELESPSLKDDDESEHNTQVSVSVTESPDTLFQMNQVSATESPDSLSQMNHVSVMETPDTLSPWFMEKGMSSSRSLKLTRSRSCNASFMTSSLSDWFEREEKNERTPPCGFEKEFTGRPESFPGKPSALKYSADIESLRRNDSTTSVGKTAFDDLKGQDCETSYGEICGNNSPVTGTVELSDFDNENQLADHEVQEATPKSSTKDVGLDPMEDDSESMSNFPSEFERLQRKIIELWNDCNVSLVHRTYFFLQFQGDSKDSIYLEVELKRMSILKDSLSQDNQNTELAQSIKDLRRERQWLSKRMQKKFSELDRQNLYLKWGIGLDTKDRRLQLAHRLWTDNADMQHIKESANIVAKLVGVARPEPAFKEMFGLYFASPRRSSWRFYQ